MSNLEKRLNHILADGRVKYLLDNLGSDAELFAVGGCVRDGILLRKTADLDIATNLPPEEVQSRLKEKGSKVIPTGLSHQTVTIITPVDIEPVEITTFRGPGISADTPLSLSQSVDEDLRYRDFSINSIAVNLKTGEIKDPNSGIQDLQNKKIRAIGNALARFDEDPLRLLRMIRFASTLDFEIEDTTYALAKTCNGYISRVATERIREELIRIFTSDRAGFGILLLDKLGLLEILLPEVYRMKNFEQNEFHHLDLFMHSLEVVDSCSPELTLRLAALFHDIGKVDTLSIDEQGRRHFYKHEHVGAQQTVLVLERLMFPKKTIRNVEILVKTHMRPLTAGAAGVRRLLRDLEGNYEYWRQLKEADARACLFDENALVQQLEDFDNLLEFILSQPDVSPLKNLAINGRDLMDLGLEQGPKIGEILRSLHEEVLDNPKLNSREELLKRAQAVIDRD